MQDGNHKTATEFKAHALEHFRHVEETGESIIVTYHGKPFIEVRPYRNDSRLPLDLLRGTVVHFEDPWKLSPPATAGSAD